MTWAGYVVGIVGVLITAIGGLLVAGRNAKASPYQAMADHMVWATERIKALEAERGEDRDRIEALESEVRETRDDFTVLAHDLERVVQWVDAGAQPPPVVISMQSRDILARLRRTHPAP